jgi:hypothetical protein
MQSEDRSRYNNLQLYSDVYKNTTRQLRFVVFVHVYSEPVIFVRLYEKYYSALESTNFIHF